MSVSILAQVMAAVQAVLADDENGFNAQLAAACEAAGIPAPTAPLKFEDGSDNFFFSPFGIQDLYDNEDARLPAICCYEQTAANQNDAMFSAFSGPITLAIDSHIAQENDNLARLHKVRWAWSDAMFNVFNSQPGAVALYDLGVDYNGKLAFQGQGQLIYIEDDQMWLQTTRHILTLKFHAMP